jgi:integrase
MSQGARRRALDSRGRPVKGIYLRDGVYSVLVKVDGKQTIRNTDARNVTEAVRARESLLAGLREGRIASPARTTFAEVFSEWQDSRTISERTREKEEYALRHLASLKDRPIQGITSSDIARLLRGVRDRGYAPWTQRGAYRVLSGVFALAHRRGIVTRDPMAGLAPSEKPKQTNAKPIRALTPEEVARLVAAARSERDKAQIGLGLYAGLRLGEVRGLRWGDVDFDASVIRVCRSVLEDGTPTKTKTEAGNRSVPMLPVLRRLLVAWKLRSPHPRPSDLVICTATGGHVLKRNLRRSLEAAKTKAGLDGGKERLSSHVLRHSFVSRLATDLELPATTLAQIVGHSDPGFTLRVYARDGRDEATVISDVLARAVGAKVGT